MTKTGWSIVAALALATLSVGLALGRRYALGPHHDGPPAASAWRVTLVATGQMSANEATVTLSLPPDFRHQHILDEHFASKELTVRPGKGKDVGRREVTWRRMSLGGTQPFRFTYSFRCLLGLRQPTAAMAERTGVLDAPPDASSLQPSPRIESESEEVRVLAQELVSGELGAGRIDQVSALFRYVSRLTNEPTLGNKSALDCLRDDGGDSGAKSRLLAALCRNRGIPARLVSGLILVAGQEQGLHHWAEAWVNDHWVPMCPTYHHFGSQRLPKNYLVLHVGDEGIVRPRPRLQFGFLLHDLHNAGDLDEEGHVPAPTAEFWHKLSLFSLRPAEQHLARFLLLLPLAALIVSLFRTVVGVPTFGTFSPALLGLAFLDLQALHWALAIFVLLVLAGWAMRHLLEGFHLLQVPRISALLTLIVLLLLVIVVVASHYGVAVTQYIALFPLVILTHLVERFWTVEAEDGTTSSFKTLLGTLVVAVTVTVSLAPEAVSAWMFRYPETLGVVLAVQFLLGRYTGYRILELYRFGDLLTEVSVPTPRQDAAVPTNGEARSENGTGKEGGGTDKDTAPRPTNTSPRGSV